MICSRCQTENSADNKYCRECGVSFLLPDIPASREEVMRRQAKVAELLADALRLRDKGLFKEAMPFAEEAARLSPESTRALAMLTSLHEAQGEWDQAIFAMERLVALTPDSIADREKLAALRRHAAHPAAPIIAQKPAADKSPSQSSALQMVVVGGVAAVVFFSCLPLLTHRQTAAATGSTVPTTNREPIATPTFDPVTPLKEAFAAPPEPAGDPFERKRPEGDGASTAGVSPLALPSAPPQARRSRTPRTAEATPMPLTAIPPMPIGPPNTGANGTLPRVSGGEESANITDNTGESGFGSGERITVRPPSTSTNGVSAVNPTPQSYIYIKVHPIPSNSTKQEDSEQTSDTTPEGKTQSFNDAPSDRANQDMERARYLQGSGHYAEAIRAYQNALSSGVRGEAYQGIAQSYQRIGDTESARASYREAIHAYERDRSMRPRLAQQGIAVCEAALTLLGGS